MGIISVHPWCLVGSVLISLGFSVVFFVLFVFFLFLVCINVASFSGLSTNKTIRVSLTLFNLALDYNRD